MKKALMFAVMLLLGASTAIAQQTSGQINGTVYDQSGAVVTTGTVAAKNPETGLERSTKTSDSGGYVIAQLPPGTYDVRVEASGFSTALQKAVTLLVGQQLTIDFKLKPGTTSEIVEVTSEAPLIELTRSEIGGTVNPTEVKELPIIDRNLNSLALMVVGVRPAQGFDPTKTKVGNASVNGGDGRQFDFNVDGGDNKDNVVGGLVQNFTVEGIQEFNVITNRYSAESGRTVGGVVNVISKSGTNAFHGSVFSFFRNSTFDKTTFFDEETCASQGITDVSRCKPVFHRYHFGGSIGGPVVKDKFFFFGAYEHKREPGNLSVEPSAFTELALFPDAVPIGQLPKPYKDHLLTIKLDHQISDRQNMFYRYGRQRWIQPNDQLDDPFTADASQSTSNTNQFHDFVVGHNFTLSPTKVNALNLHFQDMVNEILADPGRTFTLPIAGGGTSENPNVIFPSAQIGNNVNVPQQTLIRKYQVRDDFSWTHNRHHMRFGGNYIYLPKLGGFFFFGSNGYTLEFWDDPSCIIANNCPGGGDYSAGLFTPGAVRRLEQSGGDGRFNQRVHGLALYFQDDFKVTPRLTLNLGVRWDANINFLPVQLGDSLTNSNRTISILRQVVAANPSDPNAAEGLARAQLVAGDDELLRRRTASWKEFQPRVGFAWDPTGSGRHVIRGGYGIAYDQVFQNLTLFSLQQSNPNIFQILQSYNAPSRPTAGGSCPQGAGFDVCQYVYGTDLPAPAGTITDIEFGGLGFINDPRIRDPYAQQMSIGWAWQFHPDYAFSVDYNHILGIDEPRVLQANPQIRELCDAAFPGANPADPRCVAGDSTRLLDYVFSVTPDPGAVVPGTPFGAGRLSEIRWIGTNNRSTFDSVNFQLRKRMSRRVMFQTSYVLSWSRSWGGRPTSSYGGTALNITPERQFRPNEFGRTNVDERHRFVISGVFELPGGFQLAPLFQASSARPLNLRANDDLDGDGRVTLDRFCVGSTSTTPILTPGCEEVEINAFNGEPFVQLNMRATKGFKFGERASLRLFWEFFNLFNRDNICSDIGNAFGAGNYLQPLGYCGAQGFGESGVGPLRSQFGFRFEF